MLTGCDAGCSAPFPLYKEEHSFVNQIEIDISIGIGIVQQTKKSTAAVMLIKISEFFMITNVMSKMP